MMGDMSTPNVGGTNSRTGCKRGSVGQYIALIGNLSLFVLGYHEIMVRLKNKRFIVIIKLSSIGLAIRTATSSTSAILSEE
jgi:hypothetical protein